MTALLPTPEVYAELQQAYDHFNAGLFDKQLPPCLITLQRERRTYGYFSHGRFVHHSGERTDEIAMNPSYFAIRSIRETLSTLVHEMVHGWQFHFGKPGRRGYHNREWAFRMESIGLMPSNTGEPGGRKVGEQMTHYIVDGGPFDRACAALITREFRLSWFDRFPAERPRAPVAVAGGLDDDDDDPDGDEGDDVGGIDLGLVELPPTEPVNKSNRITYRCPVCGDRIWGKPGIIALCGQNDCGKALFAPVR
ncbi:Zinc metalloproteinase Mpr protein [Burkholderia latens]|uniref:SprT-like domain-containing protein n=1 Tax=Burkholderia latens TaxID=488446 RepID=UPI0039A659B9